MHQKDEAILKSIDLFIRTDNSHTITRPKFTCYRVSPAAHMNLNQKLDYENSGYLSTFQYKNGHGLKATLEYSSKTKYVHFIFLNPQLAECFKLNGGTSGLTIENGESIPRRSDGSAWVIPHFQNQIPQIFYTDAMSIELGPYNYRSEAEVLLGGNWADHVEIFSVPYKVAAKLKKSSAKNIEDVYQILSQYAYPYSLQTENARTEAIQQRWLDSAKKARLSNWWQSLKEEKINLINLYSNLGKESFTETNHESLSALHTLYQNKRSLEKTCPQITEYFEMVEATIRQLQMLSPFCKQYEDATTHFIDLFLTPLFFDHFYQQLDPKHIEEICSFFSVYYNCLDKEINFWTIYSKELQKNEEQLTPELQQFLKIVALNCANILKLQKRNISYEQIIALLKQNIDYKKKDQPLLYQHAYLANNEIANNFCQEIEKSRDFPTAPLAKWLRDFHHYVGAFIASNEPNKNVALIKLLNDLFTHSKLLHDSLVTLYYNPNLPKNIKNEFLQAQRNGIIAQVQQIKPNSYDSGKILLKQIQNLFQWQLIISTRSYPTIYPSQAQKYFSPLYTLKKQDHKRGVNQQKASERHYKNERTSKNELFFNKPLKKINKSNVNRSVNPIFSRVNKP